MELASDVALTAVRATAVALGASFLGAKAGALLARSRRSWGHLAGVDSRPTVAGRGKPRREPHRTRPQGVPILFRGWTRRLAWALVLVPYLTPSILVGYGWAGLSLSLVRHPELNEILYSLLLLLRLAPAATVVHHLAPRPMSDEAAHCRRLVRTGCQAEGGRRARRLVSDLGFWLAGPGAPAVGAFAVVFLFAFGDFELASLMGIRASWSVSLFEAHAEVVAVGESLRLAVLPAAVEATLLFAAAALLLRGRGAGAFAAAEGRGRLGPTGRRLVHGYLVLALGAATLVPLLVVLRGAATGMGEFVRSFRLAGHVASSVLLGLAAGTAAYLVAGLAAGPVVRRRAGTSARLALALALAAPGLLGALVLSLVVLRVFQLPGLRAAYDTVLPLIFTVTMLIMPFAVILRALVMAFRPGEALHAAGLARRSADGGTRARAARIAWHLDGRARAWAAFLLFVWGYFDMTASYLLAPSGTTPVFVRLYDLMHFGRSAPLSAMTALACLAPLAVLLVSASAIGLYLRFESRTDG